MSTESQSSLFRRRKCGQGMEMRKNRVDNPVQLGPHCQGKVTEDVLENPGIHLRFCTSLRGDQKPERTLSRRKKHLTSCKGRTGARFLEDKLTKRAVTKLGRGDKFVLMVTVQKRFINSYLKTSMILRATFHPMNWVSSAAHANLVCLVNCCR